MRQAALTRTEDKMIRDAQYKVGCAYFSGVGVVPNDEQCEKWAFLFFISEALSHTLFVANRWFKLAAADGDESGSVRAQTALGHWYADRHHLDLPSAFAWHSCAARNGSIQSLCRSPPLLFCSSLWPFFFFRSVLIFYPLFLLLSCTGSNVSARARRRARRGPGIQVFQERHRTRQPLRVFKSSLPLLQAQTL